MFVCLFASSFDSHRYIALAYSARLGGVKPLAQKYISQARFLSGTVYDTPDVENGMFLYTFLSYCFC